MPILYNYKKLWILKNDEEKVEVIDKTYNEKYIGEISMGMYCENDVFVEGTYITMPTHGDIKFYKKELIRHMIMFEQAKIKRASDKIEDLITKF